jgi:hypothetical protein
LSTVIRWIHGPVRHLLFLRDSDLRALLSDAALASSDQFELDDHLSPRGERRYGISLEDSRLRRIKIEARGGRAQKRQSPRCF